MNIWLIMLRKELTELWRSYKWLWAPLVFIALGMMQPITTYFLPQILENAGGLPEGAVIEIPMPEPEQVLLETMSQYNTIGLLILVLAFMATVSGERTSGQAGMIMVKPVSYASFISVKWVAATLLMTVSLLLGMTGAWYYTEQLIGPIAYSQVALGLTLLALWFSFVMALTVCFSALLRSGAAAAFLSLLCAVLLSVLPAFLSKWMKWSPSMLNTHAGDVIMNGIFSDGVWLPISCAVIGIVLLLSWAVIRFRGSELVH